MSEPGRRGVLYGVGLGPGDPELVTLKARRILRAVPTLLVPVRTPDDESYVWRIAEPHLGGRRPRIVRLAFPRAGSDAEPDGPWAEHARCVLELLAAGQDIAFLTEGDPTLYSTFALLAAEVRVLAPDVIVEIVPGVSAITASAAIAGQPLVSRGGRLAVLPAAYGLNDLRSVIGQFDTVVLLKVNRRLSAVITLLEELELADDALLVERCGRPEQRIVRGLRGFAGPVDYLSLVVVRR